jgi:hypothetical protein
MQGHGFHAAATSLNNLPVIAKLLFFAPGPVLLKEINNQRQQ